MPALYIPTLQPHNTANYRIPEHQAHLVLNGVELSKIGYRGDQTNRTLEVSELFHNLTEDIPELDGAYCLITVDKEIKARNEFTQAAESVTLLQIHIILNPTQLVNLHQAAILLEALKVWGSLPLL